MIGVVIPAHNEAAQIGACVSAAKIASCHSGLLNEPVEILVVLDHCTDTTGKIATDNGAAIIEISACNVGAARAAGAAWLVSRRARWLAFTDADTLVSPGWLMHQLALGADAVCGTVGVADWSMHGENAPFLREYFANTYTDADGHRHIHGANLGVCANAYQKAGGFASIACSEDVALVKALEASGAKISWSAAPRVTTSARRDARARGGFGDTCACRRRPLTQ
jgi:glycosyltransferase involved in cell wall biosynthesis